MPHRINPRSEPIGDRPHPRRYAPLLPRLSRTRRRLGSVLLAHVPLLLLGCGAAPGGPLSDGNYDASDITVCSPGNATETAIFGFPLTNSGSEQPVKIIGVEVTHARHVRSGSTRVTFDLTPEQDDTWIGGAHLPVEPSDDPSWENKLDHILRKMVDPSDAVIEPGQEANMLVFFSAEKDPGTQKQDKTATVDEVTIRYKVGGRDYERIVRLEMQIKPDEC